MFSLAGPVWSEAKVVTPDTIPGTTKVDAEGVLGVVQKIPNILIVDSRMCQDRVQGHLEGFVSLPDIDNTCASLAKIIPEKDLAGSVLLQQSQMRAKRQIKPQGTGVWVHTYLLVPWRIRRVEAKGLSLSERIKRAEF